MQRAQLFAIRSENDNPRKRVPPSCLCNGHLYISPRCHQNDVQVVVASGSPGPKYRSTGAFASEPAKVHYDIINLCTGQHFLRN